MLATDLNPFAGTMQITNLWLEQIKERLGWQERGRAFQALRAVLHALRDRLTTEQSADLAAQLPLLVRGLYFEGWQPSREKPAPLDRAAFLKQVALASGHDPAVSPEEITHAVFHVLAEHLGPDILIPHLGKSQLASLWPVSPARGTFYFEDN